MNISISFSILPTEVTVGMSDSLSVDVLTRDAPKFQKKKTIKTRVSNFHQVRRKISGLGSSMKDFLGKVKH